jgi:hypothetical protein
MALAETDDGVQALLRRVDQCRDRYGWTPVERRSAFLFAIGSIAEAGMRQSLAGRGIDFDALQAMVVADAVFVDSIYAEPPAEDPVRPFMDRHTAELVRIMGPTLAETDNARRTGLYIAFVAAREAGRRHFASR